MLGHGAPRSADGWRHGTLDRNEEQKRPGHHEGDSEPRRPPGGCPRAQSRGPDEQDRNRQQVAPSGHPVASAGHDEKRPGADGNEQRKTGPPGPEKKRGRQEKRPPFEQRPPEVRETRSDTSRGGDPLHHGGARHRKAVIKVARRSDEDGGQRSAGDRRPPRPIETLPERQGAQRENYAFRPKGRRDRGGPCRGGHGP